jgi:hypothetical protein
MKERESENAFSFLRFLRKWNKSVLRKTDAFQFVVSGNVAETLYPKGKTKTCMNGQKTD